MIEKLPVKFENKMRELLGDEYQAFEAGFSEQRYGGVRYNALKTDKETFEKRVPFEVENVAWINNGYYYSLGTYGAFGDYTKIDCPSCKHSWYFNQKNIPDGEMYECVCPKCGILLKRKKV